MRDEIYARLLELAEPGEFAEFSRRICMTGYVLLGVRLPQLRRLAKEICRGDWQTFLQEPGHGTYEEIMLEGMVLAGAKTELAEKLARTCAYLPKIDCWALVDSVVPTYRFKPQELPRVREFILPLLQSEREFDQRFALVVLLDYFLTPEYAAETAERVAALQSDKYYVNMARAWLLAGLAVQMFWCAQALAAKGLAQESRNVYKELQKQDLPAARKAVARIVGRDTQNLTAEGVTKAAVETVAENASDGVIAPLLYMLLGGAPLALTYKAINTMDSMLGYKNQKYLYFGRAAARLDDVANYLPSRLAGLLWVAAAALTGSSARGAWKIWRRDRRNHASPNSAQTESACAGALGVQLAGPAYYFGEYYDKPTIGDALRPVEPKDILRADRMMYAESLLALVLGIALRLLVLAM